MVHSEECPLIWPSLCTWGRLDPEVKQSPRSLGYLILYPGARKDVSWLRPVLEKVAPRKTSLGASVPQSGRQELQIQIYLCHQNATGPRQAFSTLARSWLCPVSWMLVTFWTDETWGSCHLPDARKWWIHSREDKKPWARVAGQRRDWGTTEVSVWPSWTLSSLPSFPFLLSFLLCSLPFPLSPLFLAFISLGCSVPFGIHLCLSFCISRFPLAAPFFLSFSASPLSPGSVRAARLHPLKTLELGGVCEELWQTLWRMYGWTGVIPIHGEDFAQISFWPSQCLRSLHWGPHSRDQVQPEVRIAVWKNWLTCSIPLFHS